MRFVQLLPRRYADTRTYNMLVSVCAAAGDVTSALHAADMLRSTGGKPDTIMYTNLIAGARAMLHFVSYRFSQQTGVTDLAHHQRCAIVDVNLSPALTLHKGCPAAHVLRLQLTPESEKAHNNCAACAAGADADEAFRLYGQMRRDGVPLECQTFSALLNAFSAEARNSPSPGLRWRLTIHINCEAAGLGLTSFESLNSELKITGVVSGEAGSSQRISLDLNRC